MQFAFFGTSSFSIFVLEELVRAGLTPSLIITTPDKPAGRGHKLTPSPVAAWAADRAIEVRKPEQLDADFCHQLASRTWDLFVVASYGKIIPKAILDTPAHGALNVHPSLLPLFRGASPIQSQIIAGTEAVGVTIMLMDEKMDHGPIVAQEILPNSDLSNPEHLPTAGELEESLARTGGQLLARTMPEWVAGTIDAQEQDHTVATYTQKFTKEDARIDLDGDSEEQIRKIKAFTPQPGTYFFTQKNGADVRVKITDAEYQDGTLLLTSVIPEGKREMPYADFARDATHTNM